MNEDTSLFSSVAYAKKELLKEDLSLRIAEGINAAGELFRSLAFAPTQVSTPHALLLNQLEEYKGKTVTDSPLIRKLWSNRIEETQESLNQAEQQITRSVSPESYEFFLTYFYDLWLESKDQLKPNDWAVQPTEKKEVKGTEKDIEDLFKNASMGTHEPRRALELFNDYIKTLAKSGILNLRSLSFKRGEMYRESIG